MQLYVSDFVGDTLHLSTEQIGAYMLLLMAMWNAGGQLPADDVKVARVVRLSVKKWRSIAPDLMAFLETDGHQIWHKRLSKELQKSASKRERRASAGSKGGSAKALKSKEADVAIATAMLQHLPESREKEKRKRLQFHSKPEPVASPPSTIRVKRSDPLFAEIELMRGCSLPSSGADDGWNFPIIDVEIARSRLAAQGPPLAANDCGDETKSSLETVS